MHLSKLTIIPITLHKIDCPKKSVPFASWRVNAAGLWVVLEERELSLTRGSLEEDWWGQGRGFSAWGDGKDPPSGITCVEWRKQPRTSLSRVRAEEEENGNHL